jgi:hypothetical protein
MLLQTLPTVLLHTGEQAACPEQNLSGGIVDRPPRRYRLMFFPVEASAQELDIHKQVIGCQCP